MPVDALAPKVASASAGKVFSAANLALAGFALAGFPLTKTLGENLPSRL